MTINVKLNELVEALDSSSEEHSYYLDKRTGEIVMLTTDELEAAEADELISEYPDRQRESILKAREVITEPDAFLQLPDQFDVHEYEIMEDFCLSMKNRSVGNELNRLIKGSGAFGRFKNAIREMGMYDAWYQFKQNALEEIAIEWLDENQIPYNRDDIIDAPDTTA